MWFAGLVRRGAGPATPRPPRQHVRRFRRCLLTTTSLHERLARARLTGSEARVVAFIARKTVGYRKRADVLATSQVAAGTGISRGNVSSILDALERINQG